MKPVVKISLLAGCIFGAVAGLAVAVSMDFMMGSSPGGSWYDAVRNDVHNFFGEDWAAKEWFINSGIVAVILGIGLIGALLGAACGGIVGKIFSALTK
ncbi:MAG: hypothetical protein C4526_12705 [Nitrospiraceae bacterium]|nr:MAG: hypothetical protein C4526_12705 [Nitrospiraceae bacterium]